MDSPPLHCFKASQGSRSAALANSSAKDFSSWQKRHRHVANSACEHARTSENTAFAFLNISKCSNFETSYTMHFTCATHEHIQQPIQPVSRDVCICVWAAWPSAPQTFEVNAACTAWASYNDGHFGWFRMISDDFGLNARGASTIWITAAAASKARDAPPGPQMAKCICFWPTFNATDIISDNNFHRFFYL